MKVGNESHVAVLRPELRTLCTEALDAAQGTCCEICASDVSASSIAKFGGAAQARPPDADSLELH